MCAVGTGQPFVCQFLRHGGDSELFSALLTALRGTIHALQRGWRLVVPASAGGQYTPPAVASTPGRRLHIKTFLRS